MYLFTHCLFSLFPHGKSSFNLCTNIAYLCAYVPYVIPSLLSSLKEKL